MLLFTLLPFWGRNGGNPATWAEQQLSDVASSTFTSPLNSQWTSLFSSPPHGLTLTHFSFRIYWSVFPPTAAMNKSQERDREAVVAGRQRRTEREEEEEDEEEALCWLSAGPFEPVSEHLVAITAAVSVGWSNEKTYFCHIMAALLCGFSPQSVCLKEKTGPSGSSSWIQVVVYLKQCGVVWSVCGTLWGKHFPVTTIIPKAKLIERCFFLDLVEKELTAQHKTRTQPQQTLLTLTGTPTVCQASLSTLCFQTRSRVSMGNVFAGGWREVSVYHVFTFQAFRVIWTPPHLTSFGNVGNYDVRWPTIIDMSLMWNGQRQIGLSKKNKYLVRFRNKMVVRVKMSTLMLR